MTAFIAAALVLIAAYFVQMRIFRRHIFDDLTFTEKLDETEVTVGDDIYLYEEITNDKGLPIPYLKADLDPAGRSRLPPDRDLRHAG